MGLACTCSNLRRASRAVTQLFDAHFDEVGLKATQFTVLAALAYAEGTKGKRARGAATSPTIGQLAETLVLEQSSLSRNLGVLERLGFVRLVAGQEDRRERNVTLTRAGRGALAKGFPIWKRAQGAIAGALASGEVDMPTTLDVQLRSLRRLTRVAQQLRPHRARTDASEPRRPSPARTRTLAVTPASPTGAT